MHSDDGIVLRLPDTDAEPPGGDIAVFEPDEIEALVTAEVGGSALFASRFRECAARSLLLPRRDPRRRTPLWQQRQRANQLLQVASEYGDFPVVLEAMRECLQDVFDVPGPGRADARPRPRARCGSSRSRRRAASPFARSLLFGYVGMFLYEGDAPLAERRAQALSLDSALLAELLGATDLRELLDADAIAQVEAEIARLAAGPAGARARTACTTCCARVGDLTTAEALARGATAAGPRRARGRAGARSGSGSPASSAGWRSRTPAGSATRSARRCRSACPRRSPSRSATRSATWSSRYARTHGPFVAAGRRRPARPRRRRRRRPRWPGSAAAGRLVQGEFRPGGVGHASGATPRCCARSAAARWPRCARRSSRCRPRRWPGSSRPGRASAPRSARGVDGAAARGRAAGRRRRAGQRAGVAGPAEPGRRLLPRACSTS